MGGRTNLKTALVMAVFLLGMAGTAAGGTIYVDAGAGGANNGSSWADAYLYLQDALAGASGGDDIWVAAGTYYPDANTAVPDSNDRAATFQLIDGVAIYGGFAGSETGLEERDWVTNETILSGDINVPDVNTDNSYHVVTGSGTEPNAVLDGFTITAGNANGGGSNNNGGGMYNGAGSSPTVTNCTFSGNSAVGSGGGMYNGVGSDPTVTNCTFTGNSANEGGGMYNNGSSNPTVTNCTFSGNSANYGGGMFNEASSSPTVTNCTFSGNSATDNGGGMYNNDSSPTVTNCTFSGNSALATSPTDGGGGMFNDLSSPMVTNCTFSGNSADFRGGGMYNIASSPTVTNCIFWGNGLSEIYPGSLNVTYSNVEGGYSGTGNINADPLFVDAAGGDLRLSAGSPCIDAADNTAVPADTADLDNDADTAERTPLDLDGEGRFINDPATADTGLADPPDYPQVVDMGAYEYGVIIYVDEAATGANDGTSWGNAYNYLADALADADARTEPVEIWVAEGTYEPDEGGGETPGDRMATFRLINGVAIYGGFPASGGEWSERDPNAYETILSGDIGTAGVGDNSYHVVTGSDTEPNAVLDGFTITKGNADGGGLNDYGGGMFNNSGSPTVTSCAFSGNSAANGGGMNNLNSGSPTVTNCTFSGNSANYGGGMFNGVSSPTVTNCTFSGNLVANSGGGMYNNSSPGTELTNCTFSGNSAAFNGGGIHNDFSNSTINNCILWGNTDGGPTDESAQIYNSGSTPDVNYCCIEGLDTFVGGGNIGDDPLFKAADLSLSFDSPCIDAGDNNSVPADTADLDNDGNTSERTPLDLAGNARFTDDPVVVDTGNGTAPIVEMGAYERYEFCGSGVYLHPDGDISGPDGIPDCLVDFFDFVVVAAHWLEYTGPE